MRRGAVAGAAVACVIAGMVIYAWSAPPDREPPILHARLASPDVYEDGLFHAQISVERGSYEFSFVPSGDSPRTLDILVSDGGTAIFSESFRLKSTEQGTESARYYTWDYTGQNRLDISEDYDSLQVRIDPRGDTLGPVTVFLREAPDP